MTGGPRAVLELPPPAALQAGRATAVLVLGRCAGIDPRRLRVAVDGHAHAPQAAGLARPGTDTPRGGFWATVPVPARPAGAEVVLGLVEEGADGTSGGLELARVPVRAAEAPPLEGPAPRPQDDDGPVIAVCLATYDPDPALLRVQLESLRAQTDRRWVCVVSDDGSPPAALADLRDALAGDPRFALSVAPQRAGFYRNFERALRLVPPDASLIALCDQDDRWHPDKLERLRSATAGGAVLAYSDQRLTDARGTVLRESMWVGRSANHDDVAATLVANGITGAAMLLRRELLDLALPFPDPPGFQFHDHWLAVCALAAGDVAYVPRPLYDYVQHAGAVFGDVSTGGADGAARPTRRLAARAAFDAWRGAYFHGYLGRAVQARAILVRDPPGLSPARRRALRRFVRAERSPLALAWLAGRAARTLTGRHETLGSELGLARGVLWLWWARLLARLGPAVPQRLADGAAPPPWAFSQKRLRRWRARSRTAAGTAGDRC